MSVDIGRLEAVLNTAVVEDRDARITRALARSSREDEDHSARQHHDRRKSCAACRARICAQKRQDHRCGTSEAWSV